MGIFYKIQNIGNSVTEKMKDDEIISCVLELVTLSYRIKSSLSLYKNTTKNLGPNEEKNDEYHENIDTLIIACEHMGINLQKLCEIQGRLRHMLRNMDKKNLDASLEPSWRKIESSRTKLRKFRNSLVHSRDQSINWKPRPDLDPSLQIQMDVVICAHAAIYYALGILRNLTPELQYKIESLLKQINQYEVNYDFWYQLPKAEDISKKILDETNFLLKKHGYHKTSC